MAPNDIDISTAIANISEGLFGLSTEFASLAHHYKGVKAQLQDHVRECDHLRKILGSRGSGVDPASKPRDTDDVVPDLSECFAGRREERNAILEPFADIRSLTKAEEALARLAATRLIKTDEKRVSEVSLATHQEPSSDDEVPRALEGIQVKGAAHGCPFAARQTSKPTEHCPPHPNPKSLPTPSRSHSPATRGRRMKRASHNDPLRPDLPVHKSDSQAESSASAPACPIRFLDQHTPEDIAAYFEQHKHELPRSHEICVKRFQSNSDSIAELDAKYGNLVTMIQGLGQKHKPMLPADPDPEEAVDELDEVSNRKIRAWSRAVSNSADSAPTDEIKEAKREPSDERRGHFDRPLRDVRVGESPSRPWGVPIPAKYLDQAERAEARSSVALDDSSQTKEETRHVLRTSKEYTSGSALSGRCPMVRARQDVVRTVPDSTNKSIPVAVDGAEAGGNTGHAHHRVLDGQATYTEETQEHQTRMAHGEETSLAPSMRCRVSNNSVIVVSKPRLPDNLDLTNNGTLILGFPEHEAKSLIEKR